jgi:hypothetical protein
MTNSIISFSPSVKKAKRLSKVIDRDQAYELAEIVQRAYKPKPDPKDIQELQKWLEEYPEVWTFVFDMAQLIEGNLIKRIIPDQAAHLALEKNVDEIRTDLGYEDAPQLERMLIDSIVVSWLRYQWTEYRLMAYTGPSEGTTSAIAFWEKRLSVAQGRYLKACETLAKVRKLSLKNPLLQVNIATESGQQVNVAGDLIKK